MDRIWAPWRIGYIKSTGKKQFGCLFCRSLKFQKQNHVFLKNKYSFAMLNKFPYNNGHVMISPNRHTPDLKALTEREFVDIFNTLKQTFRLLKRILKPQGYNLGVNIGKCGGVGIPSHLHLHIVPRWDADTNFMPATSNTKIISQSLDALYRELDRESAKILKKRNK